MTRRTSADLDEIMPLVARLMRMTHDGQFDGKSVAVYSAKGGVGKTTITAELGLLLSQLGQLLRRRAWINALWDADPDAFHWIDRSFGQKVVLIDGDGQASLSRSLMGRDYADTAPGLCEVLDGSATVGQVQYQINEHLTLLPGSSRMYLWQYNEDGVRALGRVIEQAGDALVLVDLCPAFSDVVRAGIYATDRWIIPTLPAGNDVMSLRTLYQLASTLRYGAQLEHAKVLLNGVDERLTLHQEAISLVRGPQSPFDVFAASIPNAVAIESAANMRTALTLWRPRHRAALNILEVAVELGQWLAE